MFDTICHEHLEYYSYNSLKYLLIQQKPVSDHNYNDILPLKPLFLCHENANLRSNTKKINKIIKDEKNIEIEEISTYKKFKKRIDKLKLDLNIIINKIIIAGSSKTSFAASTKGNVLLQYYDLNNDNIKFISDRNPRKKNLYTPGTNIKIITESESRKMKPDYYLVLAWHFEKEILSREKLIRKKGTKFIFPLPKIKVV